MSKAIDVLLILTVFYAIYTFGRYIGDYDGFELGYMRGYSSYWHDAYDALRDSLTTLDDIDNIK